MPSTSDAPTTRQVMLSLAYLAYCGDQITTANPDQQIRDLVARGMLGIPVLCTTGSDGDPAPNWTQVWGPVTYTTPGALYQDNMMYVAQSVGDPGRYVIAIRGTNHVADLDWLMDDFDIRQQMPWPLGCAPEHATGLISESTSIGLRVLLSMTDGDQTLLQFLDSVTDTALDLWVTGHSLGGCLASALGLYLAENPDQWRQNASSTVSCTTFAAPTAGNGAFAALVDGAFQNTTFDRVACSLDIVPMAWVAANVYDSGTETSPIFDIYDEGGSKTEGIDFCEMEGGDAWSWYVLPDIIPSIQSYLATFGYAQPASDAVPLTGTFLQKFSVYDKSFEVTAEAFAAEAAYQHSESYPILLGVPELNDWLVINESGGVIDAAERPVRRRPPLLFVVAAAAFKGLRAQRAKLAQAGTAATDPATR